MPWPAAAPPGLGGLCPHELPALGPISFGMSFQTFKPTHLLRLELERVLHVPWKFFGKNRKPQSCSACRIDSFKSGCSCTTRCLDFARCPIAIRFIRQHSEICDITPQAAICISRFQNRKKNHYCFSESTQSGLWDPPSFTPKARGGVEVEKAK